MIDDKKIEAAKEEIYEDRFLLNGEEVVFDNDAKEEMFYKEDIKEAIKLGAKWAIEQFLKDLGHPIEEMPNENNEVICVDKDSQTVKYNNMANWWAFCRSHNITQWIYIEDLFPKEGGEK